MAFVRQIRVKDGEYWILEHTIRKGKRYSKKTKYIGKHLPTKARLEHLKKEFLKELAGQKYKYLSIGEVEKIEKKKNEHKEETRRLSPLERNKFLKEFVIRFTYDSSKLSGVDVTLRQTALILKDGIMPKNIKSLKTAKELENHEKGFMAITKYKGKLTILFIKKIHKILFAGIDDSIAGKLRNELKRDVKLAGTSYIPPKWKDLQKELNLFFKWYKTEHKRLHALELAALLHLKIISIQPFTDGNSRLARLLMNWVLWKRGHPPLDIPIDDLEDYYDALDLYQIEKKEKPFVDYIVKRYLK